MRHLLSRVRRFARFESQTVRRFVTGYPAVRSTRVLQGAVPVTVERLMNPAGITNPSVTLFEGERVIAARTVTYRLSRLRRSMVPIPGRHRTSTFLLRPDAEGGRAVQEVDFVEVGADREFEDARVVAWRGSLWGLWTESRTLPDGHYLNAMVLGRLEGARVVELIELASPYGRDREKNWRPIVDGDRLLLMYDLGTLEVHELTANGLRAVHRASSTLPQLHRQSGSSQFVPYDGGWLGVTHRSLIRPLALPWLAFAFYRHSFVLLNADFSLRTMSAPFFIRQRSIEFCAGLVVEEGTVTLSFGESDTSAALLTMTRDRLDALLEEVS